MTSLPKPKAVHYLGPADSYSGILAEQLYPADSGILCIPEPSFGHITDAVENNQLAMGLLPMENNTSSTVHENADAIFRRNLMVIGEAALAINVHLIGIEGAAHGNARIVYSHLQALKQCHRYIHRHGLEVVEANSTATAADVVQERQDPAVVCLGALKLVERAGLEVIEADVGDYKNNKTTFFVVRRREVEEQAIIPPANGDILKMTAVVELKDKISSLGNFLVAIGDQGADLKIIESQPIPEQDGEYSFWLNLEARASHIPSILEKAAEDADRLDVLGIYRPGYTYQS